MLEAMMSAEVGDDVFGEDPTVNKLQERIAGMFGKEAALFVPSGTMGNEVSIKAHTSPGDEVIVEQDSHVVIYETAAPAFLSGVQLMPVKGVRGVLAVNEVKKVIRPRAYYLPRTSLVCVENTHGRSGGSVVPAESLRQLYEFARGEDIRLHLDGARLWNACVATGLQPRDYARYCDSLSVCFSKGLGAPVGSMIVGSQEFIEKARRYRKLFGGGMRQVGILAAAALYALDHNVDRLKEDHSKARFLAEALSSHRQLGVNLDEVQTNMVIIETERSGKTQSEVLSLLKSRGVLLTTERATAIRAVTHLDVSMEAVKEAAAVFHTLFA
jgi:threonine aldolase